ncbi:hypothetical protein CJ178_22605 [Rhodococcus sp. ACPA4]|uniref:hypothetical protein n=1 Tax=Rhodococcus TaxID=1827 RepID=UPI000BB122F3|nr:MULTISPECIES: hypothetical protein [Rhodococcus]MCE4265971.1 hypothetical protein [Rhodococcus globerulus]PBC44022.1 hypothetical protein CJ178_22605 [Rhodococcus sp. ACPA4]RZL21893.1 MAG: hypothetical protein EOP31_25450 [Rhodococcus sp. (in: high G+C Gram-positive bacteria)]
MGTFLQADLDALQQLSTDLQARADEVAGVDAVAPVADAYLFLAGRISALADATAHTARLLGAADRDFAAALHRI